MSLVQTLFLGCSITKFNINLGWGEDNSQANITLVYDDSTSASKVAARSDGTKSSLTNKMSSTLDIPTQNSYVIAENIPSDTTNNAKKRLWPTSSTAFKGYEEADPNFIGLNYDIIGCPARFKYDTNLEFGGLVKSWTTLGSTSGKDIYEVILQGYSSLLNNSYLIINNYIGSISDFTGDGWASPMIVDTPTTTTPTLYQGNIPNVFNVFGFYESASFGSSLKNDRGMSAKQIYNFLKNNFSSSNIHNPYGGLIGKTVAGIDGRLVGTSSALHDQGLCRSINAADNIKRSLYSLDISSIPVPPDTLYIPDSVISIGAFIKILCDGAGCDYAVTFINSTSGNFTGTIKIKTISRRNIPSANILKDNINNLINQNSSKVSSYSYGQEFSDTPLRLMYIGGKQKRLYQALSTNLSQTQTTMVFDPYKNGFMPLPPATVNEYMVPDRKFTRRFQSWTEGVGYVAQKSTTSDFYSSTKLGNGYQRWKNNYENVYNNGADSASPSSNYPIYNDIISPYFGMNGDTYSNSGAGNFSGTENEYSRSEARKVYWDKETNQLKIVFIKNDITRVLSNPYYDPDTFIVIENELRAAGAGFESWFTYCFDNFFTTHIELLMKGYFDQTYGIGSYFKAISVIKWNTIDKQSAAMSFNNHPGNISIENANTYIKAFYQDLNKVWEIMKKVHDTYYGKSYMVRTPSVRYYQDPSSGQYFYNWQISTDGAWEENGTFIDDTMVVGSTVADVFRDEVGKIKPILGFNANADKSTKDDWLDTKLQSSAAGGMAAMHAVIQKEYRKYTSRKEQNKFFYFPLEHNLDPSNYAYIEYKSPSVQNQGYNFPSVNDGSFQTPKGDPIPPGYSYKMYVAASVQEQLVYIDNNPRAILSIDRPIKLGGGKNECERSLVFTMLHDAILANKYDRQFKSGLNSNKVRNGALLAWFLCGNARTSDDINTTVTVNDSAPNVPIEPKATCPAFAAVPVQFNLATYGPWIDNPGKANLFSADTINNLAGSVRVQEDSELVPWNYGGMENLDSYVCKTIDNDAGYQQVYEKGELSLVGINTSIGLVGDVLVAGGPLISNIIVDINENGITSSYTLRTYTRKLGFFNKDNTDRFKQLALENFRQKKALNDSINEAQNELKANFAQAMETIGGSSSTPKQLKWSPVKILSGANRIHVHENSSVVTGIPNYNPGWFMAPYGNVNTTPVDLPRYLGDIGLYETDEAPKELLTDYDKKSIMSLDGILSPISFYPNPYGSTYNITKYPRSRCPICLGKGKYSYKKLNNPSFTRDNLLFNTITNNIQSVQNVDCAFCEKDEVKTKNQYIGASPKETTPPFIIASGNDLEIISRNSMSALSGISGNPIINYSTLNPILLTSGEFGCVQNRQNNDTTPHCIDMVSNGIVPPYGDNSLKLSYSKNINNFYDPIDYNYNNYCKEYNITKPIYTPVTGYPNTENLPANNMRFFGLRGPVMVHGWGYDTEGYPVPNASGEILLESDGTAKKDSLGNILYKNQTLNADGTWTKPYKEHKFFNGWGQMPGTWPVGPIDLRWDDKARVWTVGANYKNVWIQIENDLVNKQPSRGQIISDLDNNPLPSGLRKLVFVKDELQINPAPRGAKIYCRYNGDTGFYEAIYNRPFITSGIIQGNSSVQLYQVFSSGNISYTTTFINPMEFSVSYGNKGIFVYIDTDWVLQSYN